MNNVMHTIEVLELVSGSYQIKGDLTFSHINKSSLKIFDLQHINSTETSIIQMDLQQLGKIDSAGLALLIEWIKLSHTYKKELRFNNIPAPLSALAKLSYLSDINLLTTKNN